MVILVCLANQLKTKQKQKQKQWTGGENDEEERRQKNQICSTSYWKHNTHTKVSSFFKSPVSVWQIIAIWGGGGREDCSPTIKSG